MPPGVSPSLRRWRVFPDGEYEDYPNGLCRPSFARGIDDGWPRERKVADRDALSGAASLPAHQAPTMDRPDPVTRLTVPLGGQQIEMHQIDYEAGGMSLLRVRIREGKRFTVFDIDPATAATWGEALQAWGRSHPRGSQ